MTRYFGLSSVLLAAMLFAGCGGGSPSPGSSGGDPANPIAAANVVPVTVGPGPASAGNGTFNIPYVSVTVCQPNTSHCATIDHVLVDTGSFGLRLFASVLTATGLNLPDLPDPNNGSNTVGECVPFVDGYIWGPLTTAKVQIGGETAGGITVHIINDDGSYAPTVPTNCTSLTGSTSLNSVAAFHANGILGVGLAAEDCGDSCAQCALSGGGCNSTNDYYYSCNAGSNICQAIAIPLAAQVVNPVSAFATDNNGVILELAAVGPLGATLGSGALTFGIGTQSNNALGNAVVLQTDNRGFITTVFNGHTLTNSFIDSGSNGLYFDDNSLPTCPDNSSFYCPVTTTNLSATNQGSQGSVSSVSFQVANLDSIPASHYAISTVGGKAAVSGGTIALSNDFDFGLPFFYGRRVFTAIAGASAGSNQGPFFAY